MVDGCCSARHVQPRPSGLLLRCTDELGNRWRKIITSPARPTEGHLSASLHLELLFPASGLAVACECVSLAVAMLCMRLRLRLRPSTPSSSPHPLTTASTTTSTTSTTTTTLCRSPMASAPPLWRASTAKLDGLPRTACLPSQSSGSAACCGFRPVGVQDRPSGARLLMHHRMAVSHPMRP
jgi:hypothetical protein